MNNCMGSGSVGVACKNKGRQFIGIEADGLLLSGGKRTNRKRLRRVAVAEKQQSS